MKLQIINEETGEVVLEPKDFRQLGDVLAASIRDELAQQEIQRADVQKKMQGLFLWRFGPSPVVRRWWRPFKSRWLATRDAVWGETVDEVIAEHSLAVAQARASIGERTPDPGSVVDAVEKSIAVFQDQTRRL